MEPDDLSILKLSLTSVKERAFPGRGALKKKSRHKRGKRQKEDKELLYEDNVVANNKASDHGRNLSKEPGQPIRPRQLHKTGYEMKEKSWREIKPDQEFPTSGFSNTAWTYLSSSESELSDSESGQAQRLRCEKCQSCCLYINYTLY